MTVISKRMEGGQVEQGGDKHRIEKRSQDRTLNRPNVCPSDVGVSASDLDVASPIILLVGQNKVLQRNKDYCPF